MRVRDHMTPHPLSISPETTVPEALRLLDEHRFRRLPVLENGKLIGIVTAKDLKDAQPSKANTLSVWELSALLERLAVRDIMAFPVITVLEDDYIEDAALKLQEYKIGGLSVVNHSGRLVGLLTITDVLEAFIQTMGYGEGGKRLTLTMPDVPGSLARAVRAVIPSNILSVATAGADRGERRFVLRVVGEGLDDVEARVEDAGIEVE